jgi:trigger factor
MQSNFEKITSTMGSLKVDIVEADYKQAVEKKVREYAKTASVKGFRPGNVPVQYIKNIYGKGILVDEVIKIASDEVNRTIKDNNLNAVGEPTPKEDSYDIDWGKQTEFSFEYNIGFASDIKVDVEKLPVITQYDIIPGSEHVNTTVEDLLNRFGKETEPETSEIGDLVFGELRQAESEFFFQSGIPTDKVKADAQFTFKGLEKDSKVSFDIQSIFESDKELGFATGKSDEDAAALQGTFELTVTKITRMGKGEMNQEFFDKVLGPGKATDKASFESQLTDIIKDNYARETDFLLNFDVEKMLVDAHPMELPDAFLKDWLLEINKGKVTAEDVEKEYPNIANGLKLDFIKTEVAKQLDIKVEYTDVVEEVKAEIRGYFGQMSGGGGFDGMEEFIETMATKQLKEKKQEETRKYFEKAFGKKVVEAVKAKVKKDVKVIGVDEFNTIAKEKYQVA